MNTVHQVNTARVEDHGFVRQSHWDRTERLYDEARGDGQFVALIEGITSEDGETWIDDGDLEKPGRLITVGAENYADLAEAVEWVHATYDVFATHVQADDSVQGDNLVEYEAAERAMDEIRQAPAEAQDWETELVRPPQDLPVEALAQAEHAELLEAIVRQFAEVAVNRAIDRFPNDAAAALRYASALLAVSAEEV